MITFAWELQIAKNCQEMDLNLDNSKFEFTLFLAINSRRMRVSPRPTNKLVTSNFLAQI